jgi:digalactosyldiacylglycerol synthase
MKLQARFLLFLALWAVFSCFASYQEVPRHALLLPLGRGGSTTQQDSVVDTVEVHNDTTGGKPPANKEPTELEESEDSAASQLQRRRRFLDRIHLVSRNLLLKEHDAVLDDTSDLEDDKAITPQSDLMRPGRHMTVVTTAALPWFTGTAVNPLLRAGHLVRMTKQINQDNTQWVTLIVPWLELEQDRQLLYHSHHFESPQDQEAYIREWLAQEAGMPDVADSETGLRIMFYPARYHTGLMSIFAMGDVTALIPPEHADVVILEEPEHLNFFRYPGEGWSKKFHFVVGIVHTNYKDYASSQYHGLWTAPALAMISSAMVRAYCHKVIKLSDVLQTFAPEKEFTSNVHGVRADFLKEGIRRAEAARMGDFSGERKIYFIGKLIWQKGFDILLDLEEYYKQCTGDYFPIDIYGSGPEQKDIMRAYLGRRNGESSASSSSQRRTEAPDASSQASSSSRESLSLMAQGQLEKIKRTIRETRESLELDLPKTFYELRRQPIPAAFLGRVDHGLLTTEYAIFVNPSLSEVLCTTTAEALAMGKFVIIPVHPSNSFFLKFPNCLPYRNKFEFVANLRWALTHDPEPLTPELEREFTWEAATERLVAASAITYREARERERLGLSRLDERIAWFHNEIGKGERGDAIRKLCGAGPVSHQVKYQRLQSEEDEEGEEGFTDKFFGSSVVKAIQKTLASSLPSLIAVRQVRYLWK